MTDFVWVGLAAFGVAGAVSAAVGRSWRRLAVLVSAAFFLLALLLAFVLPSVPPYGCTDTHSALAALQVACALASATSAGAAAGVSARARAFVLVLFDAVLGGAALVMAWVPYICSLVT